MAWTKSTKGAKVDIEQKVGIYSLKNDAIFL